MSMSISATNYLSTDLQKDRITEMEEKAAESGKARQSTASAMPDQVNLGEDGIAVNQVGRLQAAGQTVPQTQQTAPRTDIVEISEEGKAASAQLAAQAQQTQQTHQTDTASAAVNSAETNEAAEESYTEDLSEYTDTELKLMYYAGEITLQEYEDETGETLE